MLNSSILSLDRTEQIQENYPEEEKKSEATKMLEIFIQFLQSYATKSDIFIQIHYSISMCQLVPFLNMSCL
jgi:hypothetical protein